jgi:CHAT domain-containing protein
VHWCPTGEFTTLPLHAAGIYTGSHQICASDYILSSYTPSLSILIKCQDAFTPIPCVDLKALLVAEANAPGFSPLHNVVQEVNAVAKLFPSTASVINEIEAVPTADSVIDGLRTAHVLHLACHGRQMPDPLKSHFVLRDTVLSIETLMKVELPSAVFAFLSACETAKGDRDQPDQAVHLAASMLFCGFRSVVATMW